MAQLTESDKALIQFQSQNASAFAYILVTSEGLTYQEVVKYTGLIYDLILFCKKTLDDLKRSTLHTPISLRLRLKHGVEIIIIQEQDFYFITLQMCKCITEEPKEGEKKN